MKPAETVSDERLERIAALARGREGVYVGEFADLIENVATELLRLRQAHREAVEVMGMYAESGNRIINGEFAREWVEKNRSGK